MNYETSSAHSHESSMPRLVEEARRHWEARQQPRAGQRDVSSQASQAYTVALSRGVGTQGTSVAQQVGRLLGWHIYDHELVASRLSVAQRAELTVETLHRLQAAEIEKNVGRPSS